MNKILYALFPFFLLLVTVPVQGAVVVEPPEITITINEDFIQENSPANITILNKNNYTINATWYIEHPNPPSYLRPNRTFIENLSWVHVTPAYQLIAPSTSASFSIILSIPKRNDLLDQHWETWVTIVPQTEEDGGLFAQEYAIRVYIDTPVSSSQPSTPDSNTQDYSFFTLLLIIGTLITASILALFWFWKKKSP